MPQRLIHRGQNSFADGVIITVPTTASYLGSCGSGFSTYRSDIDVCNHAGGASVIAAAAGGATGLSVATTAGTTYVLAKAAFELCQRACRSQGALQKCVETVDTAAKGKAATAKQIAQENDAGEARLAEFACVDDAYAGEKLLVIDSLLAKCEADETAIRIVRNFKRDSPQKSMPSIPRFSEGGTTH